MADVKTRTTNFRFILPDFNQVTWHTDLYENFRAVDSIITRFFNIANYEGVWTNATVYSVGDRVLDTELALIFEARIAHTSATTGDFSAARTANPTYWEVFTQEIQFRSTWVASTNYAAGDFVTYERSSGNKVFATATTSHLSSASFEDDEADGLWTVLLEQQSISDADLVAIAAFTTETGMLARTAGATYAFRTITGTANKVTVTNGNGVSGNPTLTLPDAITLVTPTITGVATFQSNILPNTDGSINLGSSAIRFAAAYADAVVSSVYKLDEVLAPSTAVNQGALYTKNDGTQTELFFRSENDGTELQLTKAGGLGFGIVDVAEASYTANADLTTNIPLDDTIPQNTEGTEILTASITPKTTTNRIRVRVSGMFTVDGSGDDIILALFRDSLANALYAVAHDVRLSGVPQNVAFEYNFGAAATTSTMTFKLRVGASGSSTLRANGTNTGRLFGGVAAVRMVVEEFVG